jgi:hypothetical protein
MNSGQALVSFLLSLAACWIGPTEAQPSTTQLDVRPPSARHPKYTCHQFEQLLASDSPKEPSYSQCNQWPELVDFYWCLYTIEQEHAGALHWWIDIAGAACMDEGRLQ